MANGRVCALGAAEEGAVPAADVSAWATLEASMPGPTSWTRDVGSAVVSVSPVAWVEGSARGDEVAGISDAMQV